MLTISWSKPEEDVGWYDFVGAKVGVFVGEEGVEGGPSSGSSSAWQSLHEIGQFIAMLDTGAVS